MSGLRRVLPILSVVIAVIAAAVMATPASAATVSVTRKVPATLVFRNGANPENPGNCGANVFVQWKDVPGTTHVRVHWRQRTRRPNAPYTPKSQVSAPPYNDVFDWIFDDTVTPGYHWVSVVSGWRAGPQPSDCSDTLEVIRESLDPSPDATFAELTIQLAKPVVLSTRRSVRLPASRLVEIGTVRCPKDGLCRVTAPRQVRVRIQRQLYTLDVVVPKTVRGGKRVPVRVRFTAQAARALAGRSVRPSLRVTATNHGDARTAVTVARTVYAPPPRRR